jgi:short-subunit dehydrogenase
VGVTEAFLPLLTRTGGTVVNVVSVPAFAAVPVLPAYSVSKAAVFSLSQSLRALFASRRVNVHAVMAGPIDTTWSEDSTSRRPPPESVARGVLDGVERGDEEIFPDPMSETMAESWRTGAAKTLERQNATLVAAPVAA